MRHEFDMPLIVAMMLLAGCTTMPAGPSVMALPGSGKTFDQFRLDDADCRQYALAQVGGTTANQAATDAGVRSAVVGTAVGAAAGAALGGSDTVGEGAATGLLVGSMAGVGAAESSRYGIQRRYDIAYIQCMYAKGHQVPVSTGFSARSPQSQNLPPPPPPGIPIPPPPPH